MNLGEWLGAIPNAIGKFMYDAGIPDPMADQYAKKQQFDLNKRKNEEIIKRYQLDNQVNETLAGIMPKKDKTGNFVFHPGIMGEFQKDVFVNNVPVEQAVQKYGARLGAVGGITPDKMQLAALSPTQFAQSAMIKGGLAQSADQRAKYNLDVRKFQHSSLMQNAKDVMTVISKVNDEGGDANLTNSLMKNFALALGTAGFDKDTINEVLIPIHEVASGRKDIDLNRKLYETEQRLAQGWARVNIAQQRANDSKNRKSGKEIDPLKIKLEPSTTEKLTDKKYEKYLSQTRPMENDGETMEQFEAKKKEAEAYFANKEQMQNARLVRFRTEPDFVQEMRRNGYDDERIDRLLRERKAKMSIAGESGEF